MLKTNTIHIRLSDEQKMALETIFRFKQTQSPLNPTSYSDVIRRLIVAEYYRIVDELK